MHTPGPWKIERPSRKRRGNFDEKQAITAGPFGVVCVCTRADARTDTDSPNARIIATAPELLDSLRTLLNLHEGIQDGGEGPTETDWENAREIIARATGQP